MVSTSDWRPAGSQTEPRLKDLEPCMKEKFALMPSTDLSAAFNLVNNDLLMKCLKITILSVPHPYINHLNYKRGITPKPQSYHLLTASHWLIWYFCYVTQWRVRKGVSTCITPWHSMLGTNMLPKGEGSQKTFKTVSLTALCVFFKWHLM